MPCGFKRGWEIYYTHGIKCFFWKPRKFNNRYKKLSEEDFFKKDTKKPIEIKVTFTDLSPDAIEDLGHYVRDGKLIVTARAEFNGDTAEVKQYGTRLGIKAFAPFFDASKVAEQKSIYKDLQNKFSDLPNWTTSSAKAEEAIHEYENTHKELLTEIKSFSQFYGAAKGAGKLEKYIQWVYVPAVKDASTEELEGKNSAVSRLLARAVRSKVTFDEKIATLRSKTLEEYKTLIASENGALEELSSSLEARLQSWGNPRARIQMDWSHDEGKFKIEEPMAKVSTGEQGFLGSISRLGHGLQRSYLISLLHELASLNDEGQATLVLGIEEPELYQHPPQARHLSHVLQELSGKNSQIIAATHSPYFVDGKGFETVRLIRRNEEDQAYACSTTFEDLANDEGEYTGKAPIKPTGMRANLDPLMQPMIAEMLFTDKLVLVEGLEDRSILSSWIVIRGMEKRFREKGISIIPVNGKSYLLRPAIVASRLEIPVLMVFDADGDCDENNLVNNRVDNSRNIKWSGGEGIDDFPTTDHISSNLIVWPNNIQSSVFSAISKDVLEAAKDKAREACGHIKSLDKNSVWLHEVLCIADEEKWDMSILDTACEHICSDKW
ncbi:MAG: ATP-dependent endonuclease [Robiginitomaculum sp.]|nr:MAG: ATP-dependent endonuclease [Robiginitomaculum sp.]